MGWKAFEAIWTHAQGLWHFKFMLAGHTSNLGIVRIGFLEPMRFSPQLQCKLGLDVNQGSTAEGPAHLSLKTCSHRDPEPFPNSACD